jgi:hypothetical protein
LWPYLIELGTGTEFGQVQGRNMQLIDARGESEQQRKTITALIEQMQSMGHRLAGVEEALRGAQTESEHQRETITALIERVQSMEPEPETVASVGVDSDSGASQWINPCNRNANLVSAGSRDANGVEDFVESLFSKGGNDKRPHIVGRQLNSERLEAMMGEDLVGIIGSKREAELILSEWGKVVQTSIKAQQTLSPADMVSACEGERVEVHVGVERSMVERCDACKCLPGYILFANNQMGKQCISAEKFRAKDLQEVLIRQFYNKYIPLSKKMDFIPAIKEECASALQVLVDEMFPRPATSLATRACGKPLPPIHGFYHVTAVGDFCENDATTCMTQD